MTSNHKTEKAFILGYTGETGKNIVKLLLENKIFKQLVLIGRRKVDFGGDPLYENVIQKVVDFDKIIDYKSAFDGCSTGFCCLGMKFSGAMAYESFSLSYFKSDVSQSKLYQIDHDYVVNSASVARQAGCKRFNVVSSKSSNKDSWMFYLKTKGLAEEELSKLGFDQLNIYRPAQMSGDKENVHFAEWLILKLWIPIFYMWPKQIFILSQQLAKAMVWNDSIKGEGQFETEFVENAQMYDLAETFDNSVSKSTWNKQF